MNVNIDVYYLAALATVLVTVLSIICKICKYLWKIFIKKLKNVFVKIICEIIFEIISELSPDEYGELMNKYKLKGNNIQE